MTGERWRAEMPETHCCNGYCAPSVEPDAVEALVTRANAELDAAKARERAKDERIRELEEHYASARRVCEEAQAIARARQDEVAALEARIRELTEWRPMDTAPMGEWILLLDGGGGGGRVIGKTRLPWGQFFTQSGMSIFPVGWLPLPSTEGGEG